MEKIGIRLTKKAYELRSMILEMCIKAGTGHVSSSMSCVEILVALYYGNMLRFNPKNPQWEERDRFILSKGQASPALYAILGDVGYFNKKDLFRFAQKGGKFGVHLQNNIPGVEITSGSLGHGFGIAAGFALAAKMDRQLQLVFTLLGDGECYEGSIWETAMFASHNELNNLVAIIDRNYLCVTDFTENLLRLEPLQEKWLSFGWDVKRINGHSFEEILDALRYVRSRRSSKPLVVIADTVKGYGIECISNNPLWHGMAPRGKDVSTCLKSLEKGYNNE